ncbi:hypothetical protein BV210_08690 [Halorientalis sp. IM1011]|uniref:Sjogren's syndrome/scleroderma autoantigen 1 family protein n=1 Tax=Halorientalis sp. IM1011 TaxID=1932360 RepID=UPI00097CC14D|nr:Sjogren's syndrome/scleroderma autoantigen 1 family protein [Halorientalis sp. IM1011]AQL42783.1 hypothetical protein BV210_08690 [Halorientalis sp. IM1011]
MSDFDKEAEREKLREKYGRDEDDREATERMSDLLLKGATMTNAHCGTCGDPIFRYEGQEFCPTCQQVVSEADEGGEQAPEEPAGAEMDAAADAETNTVADAETNAAADAPTDTPDEQPDRADTGTPRPGANGRADPGTADSATGTPATDDNAPADWTTSIDPSVADAVETEGQSAGKSPSTAPDRAAADAGPGAAGSSGTGSSGAGDLADARATLTNAVTRLTAQANASDDLERTRAYLAAVEEAADALAAVKRADR